MATSRFEPDGGIFKQPLHHADRPVPAPAAISAGGIRIAAHYVTPMYWGTWLRQRASYGKSQYPWSGAGKRRITHEGSCSEAERAYADHMTLACHEGFGDDYIQDIAAAPAKV